MLLGFFSAAWLALICFALLILAFACGFYVWSMVPASSNLVESGSFCLFASFGNPGCSGVASLLIVRWLDPTGLFQLIRFLIFVPFSGLCYALLKPMAELGCFV
ncbi:hypothetical protein D5086_017541 [Populus alba]|uniref:Uncharacterized protein n=1 Tax=Populus alba TaxID=43335 RepID=A0ACC4BN04_POPAL